MKSILNKKGLFNYEITERLEAGLKLLGGEVKSVKAGRVNFEGSYITVRDGEVFWVNADIPPYQPKNAPKDYKPERPRKLLLNKKEVGHLIGKSQEKGLTIIPIKIYNKRGNIKLEIGIARHKKKYDKRELLKKRATDRDIEREIRDK